MNFLKTYKMIHEMDKLTVSVLISSIYVNRNTTTPVISLTLPTAKKVCFITS